jgi:hypothetical protein
MTLRNALVLLVALVGCSQHPTGPDGDCYASLSEYCGVWPCPASYEESVAAVREAASSFCFVAQSGSCGDLLFTRSGGGFGNTTRYYKTGGPLAAVHATTDAYASGSACPDWKHYGQRLSCREVIRDDYCLR